MLMRILHWPYASKIILVAFATTGLLYVARFWKKPKKQFLDFVKLVLVVFWAANGVLRALNFPYTLFFQAVIAVTFLTWFVMEGTAYFLDEERKVQNNKVQVIWNFTMVIGALAIIAGSLLNVLNWQFAIPLLVVGIALIAAYILKDIFFAAKIEKEDQNNEEFQV